VQKGIKSRHRNGKQQAHSMSTVRNPQIIRLPVRFDATAAEEMESNALLAVKIGAHDMILDGRDTTYMTAAGLRFVLDLAREIKAAGGHLAVCNLQPQAKELFDVCGFGAVIPAYSHPDEAVAQMAA